MKNKKRTHESGFAFFIIKNGINKFRLKEFNFDTVCFEIKKAGAAGKKIWTITQDNVDVALAAINLDADTENEIRNSVNAGKVVTTHEQSINFNGWVGEGYIILDPESGAGAYKIAGGDL